MFLLLHANPSRFLSFYERYFKRSSSSSSHLFSVNIPYTEMMMMFNTLMCMDVAVLLSPLHQGMLRSAGQMGVDVFEELVAIGRVPIYVETSVLEVGVHAPIVPHVSLSDSDDEASRDAFDGDIDNSIMSKNCWTSTNSNTTAVVVSLTAMRVLRWVDGGIDALRGVRTGNLVHRYQHYSGTSATDDGGDAVGVESDEYISEDMDPLMATSIELCGFEGFTKVLNNFLVNANAISTLDITPLRFVTTIGDDFLFDCNSLTTIDLAPLGEVSSIGSSFMGQCSSLIMLDTTPLLKSLTNIGSGFLGDCCSLRDIDVTGLGNLSEIPPDFLSCCSALKSIDLAPLGGSLSVIGDRFMMKCSSILAVDLAPLTQLKLIGNMFMSMCSALTTFGNPDTASVRNTLPLLESVSDSFLHSCASLVSVNLSVLSNLTTISSMFLSSCSSLVTLDVSPLRHATTIGYSFLAHCTSLSDIDISVLWRAKFVDKGFLFGCEGVRDSGVQGPVGNAFREARHTYQTTVANKPQKVYN